MNCPPRIVLVGFMGAGKTSAGRRLAELLEFEFVDLDEAIAAEGGRSIREIFEKDGEEVFRGLEADALRKSLKLERVVIATGGGTFAFAANRQMIARVAVSAFLDVAFPALIQRILSAKVDRPLFRDEWQAHQLYSRRLESYRMADLTVSVRAEESVEEVAWRLQLQLTSPTGDRLR